MGGRRRGHRHKKRNQGNHLHNAKGQSALTSNETKIPKSLVIRRGKCEWEVGTLVEDVRKMMLPYTALQFQEDPKNRKLTLAKYCTALALPMGITHILAFSQSGQQLNLRLARTPEGPTMTFRVHQFSLSKHIKSLQRRPISDNQRSMMDHPPIVVTNNFGDATAPPHIKLMRITFQNMFPPINVATVKLTDCRRVVLFDLIEEEQEIEVDVDDDDDEDDDQDEEEEEQSQQQQSSSQQQQAEARDKPKKTKKSNHNNNQENNNDNDKQQQQGEEEQDHNDDDDDDDDDENKHEEEPTMTKTKKKKKKKTKTIISMVHVRHYAIKATPVGINRKVRRLIQTKLPNLHKVQDIADYISGTAMGGGGGDVPSDSEPEDNEQNVIQLSQNYSGRGNHSSQKSALKLVELGPRLSFQLLKVEKGLGTGDVMYHAYITKSPQEVRETKQRKEQEALLKQQRREQQEQNVERKRQAMEDKRQAKRLRKEQHEQQLMNQLRKGTTTTAAVAEEEDEEDDDEEEDDDDEAEEEEEEEDDNDSDDSKTSDSSQEEDGSENKLKKQ